ncbi:unnamed protein product [Pylaiella littoralis]
MFRAWKDSRALKALCDGVTWSARAYLNGRWVEKELTAGDLCREVLQEVFHILPLETGPASADDGMLRGTRGRPHGYLEWETSLKSASVGTQPPSEAWQQAVSVMLLS